MNNNNNSKSGVYIWLRISIKVILRVTSENKTYQSKNNCENSIHKNQEMDYQRPPSNRVKIAPARFRSNSNLFLYHFKNSWTHWTSVIFFFLFQKIRSNVKVMLVQYVHEFLFFKGINVKLMLVQYVHEFLFKILATYVTGILCLREPFDCDGTLLMWKQSFLGNIK